MFEALALILIVALSAAFLAICHHLDETHEHRAQLRRIKQRAAIRNALRRAR